MMFDDWGSGKVNIIIFRNKRAEIETELLSAKECKKKVGERKCIGAL